MSRRVLHVVRDLGVDTGGPARAVLQLADTLRRQGIEVRLAARRAPGDSGVRLDWLPFEVPTAGAARAMREAIAWAEVVHIHGLWNHTISLAAMLCQTRGVPYVVTPHGMLDPVCLVHHRRRKQVYARLVGRRTLRGAAGFHFLSEEERNRAALPEPCAERPAVVAPNGAPPPPRPSTGALRALFPELANRRVVLSLGRIDPIKGIDLQLEALSRIPEPDRPVLLVVGPDFGDEARLKALATRAGLDPWLIWAGPRYGDERFALMSDADVVLLTSVYDCNPMVIPEGLAAGAVIVATDTCGGIAAAARHGAAVTMRRTAEDVAEALLAILHDHDRRARLRARARAYAATALDRDALAEPLLGLYCDAAGVTPWLVEPERSPVPRPASVASLASRRFTPRARVE